MESVAKTRSVADVIASHDYEKAMEMRGGSFRHSFRLIRTMVRAHPHPPTPGQTRLRLAVLHGGGPAPGMSTAVRTAVRVGLDLGHTMLTVQKGFRGLRRGDIAEMGWMGVNGWVSRGGAELGTSRSAPTPEQVVEIAAQLEEHAIDGLLMVGGWAGYHQGHPEASPGPHDAAPLFDHFIELIAARRQAAPES